MKRAIELRQAISKAADELLTLTQDGPAFDAKEAEITAMEGELKRSLAAEQRQAALGRPAGTDVLAAPAAVRADNMGSGLAPAETERAFAGFGRKRSFDDCVRAARVQTGFAPNPTEHYRSFGEQLQAVANYYTSRGSNQDARLVRAPTGAGEVDPTGGGFLVQTDFMQGIFMLAHDMGKILSRVGKLPISSSANSLKINAVDETSRATGSRWGGVQAFWLGEGSQATQTKPKFRQVDFNLHKLMAIMYITDELMQDSSALGSIASTAFAEEVMFNTEDAIFEGSGVGLPLGIMNSPAKVAVAKVSGQAAGTILKANLDQMWSQLWARSYENAVWTINQEITPQLSALNQPVSSAGGQVVYMPPGGLSATPYATLYGRPVIMTEYNNALGTEGDIMLADFSQYMLVDKGGIQAATSMHVAFLTDEQAFRITYRVDGKPMWSKSMTPFKGSTQKSPFITLATRS